VVSYQQIGRRIQAAREEAGLSQAELAQRIGCTQSALSNYELGKRRLPLATLEQIARALGRPLSYFLEMGGQRPPGDGVFRLLLEDRLLQGILMAAAELPAEERRLVLDYIRWRRRLFSDPGEAVGVWAGAKSLKG